MPEWLDRLAARPPLADHWRRRHHCTDVVLGESSDVDKPCYTGPQEQSAPERKEPPMKLIRIAALIGALAAVALAGGSPAVAHNDTGDKVYVCKYTGQPGVDEVLQFGQNPIEVSVNAIAEPVVVGAYFNDAHGRSFVLGFVPMSPEPNRFDCPEGVGPSPSPSVSPEPSSEPSVEPTPSTYPSPQPSATPSPTPSVTPTPSPTPSSSPTPSTEPTPVPSASPTAPVVTPTPVVPTVTAPPTDTDGLVAQSAPKSEPSVLFIILAAAIGGMLGALATSRPRRAK